MLRLLVVAFNFDFGEYCLLVLSWTLIFSFRRLITINLFLSQLNFLEKLCRADYLFWIMPPKNISRMC